MTKPEAMATWIHANTVWDKLRKECDEDGLWRNDTITNTFREMGLFPHYSRVMRALKLMERIEVKKRSSFRNTGEKMPTEIQLFYIDQPLSIQTWGEIHSDVYNRQGLQEKKARWLTDQRLNDMVPTVTRLFAQVEQLEARVVVLEKANSIVPPPPVFDSEVLGSLMDRPELEYEEEDND